MEHLLENLELLILENYKSERYMRQNEYLYYKYFANELKEINRLEMEQIEQNSLADREIVMANYLEVEDLIEKAKYYIPPSQKLMDACDEVMLRLISLSYCELHPEIYKGTIKTIWTLEIEECYLKSRLDDLKKLELEIVYAISKMGLREDPLTEDKIKQLIKFYNCDNYKNEVLYQLGDSVCTEKGKAERRKLLLDYIETLKSGDNL